MPSFGGVRILVLGPVRLRARVLSALGADARLCDDPREADAAFVHADADGRGTGPARLAQLFAQGLRPCFGVASNRTPAVRRAFLDGGAWDVLAASAAPADVARVFARAREAEALAARVRQQDRELVLVSALARRLLRPSDPRGLLVEALDGVGCALGCARAEIRVLPDGPPGEGPSLLAAAWDRERRGMAVADPHLDRDDLEALRRREPVELEAGTLVLPLVSHGRPCGVLRLAPGAEGFHEGDLAALYGAGNLLADALAHAEQIAQLRGRSRDLEALVADRGRAAEEQRALFQAVIDTLPVSLHVVDRAHRVVVWNRGREDGPLGRPRGEMLGRNLFDTIGADPELLEEYDQVFRSGRPRTTEVESNARGSSRLYAVEKIPMRLGPSPGVTHVITFARDVTAQRSFERSIAETERLAAVGRLAAGIAHEINNPLATIAGCAEVLRTRLAEGVDDAGRVELGDDAALIESEAYRCKEILGGVLDFSRAAGDRRGTCDPAELVQRAVRLLRHNPRVGGVTLRVETAPGLPELWANEDQLVQVLLALAINAADAAAPAGTVTVTAARRDGGDEVVLAVEDDGPGIAPEIRERIFEPFFTTKPPGQGTGLGLSVAYGLVQAHGGRLEVVSQPGFGSRFEVILPAGDRTGAARGRAEGTADAGAGISAFPALQGVRG